MTKPASPTAEEVSELLASLPGAVEREIYTGRAAEAAGITAEAMKLEVQRSFKRRMRPGKAGGAAEGSEPCNGLAAQGAIPAL